MKKIIAGTLIALTLSIPAVVATSSTADAIGIRIGPRGVGIGLGRGVRRPFVRRGPVVRVAPAIRARPFVRRRGLRRF